MYSLSVKRHFSAAHFLYNYQGKCANLHGHTWQVEVILSGEKLDPTGMLTDFSVAKERLDAILPDHTNLNDRYDFNPTAENLACYLYRSFRIPDNTVLESVTVWESGDCSVTYSPVEKRNGAAPYQAYRDSVGGQTIGDGSE